MTEQMHHTDPEKELSDEIREGLLNGSARAVFLDEENFVRKFFGLPIGTDMGPYMFMLSSAWQRGHDAAVLLNMTRDFNPFNDNHLTTAEQTRKLNP